MNRRWRILFTYLNAQSRLSRKQEKKDRDIGDMEKQLKRQEPEIRDKRLELAKSKGLLSKLRKQKQGCTELANACQERQETLNKQQGSAVGQKWKRESACGPKAEFYAAKESKSAASGPAATSAGASADNDEAAAVRAQALYENGALCAWAKIS